MEDNGKEDKKFILELIRLYRSLPALWDIKSQDYTDDIVKDEQYFVLIQKYREKYPDADKQDVIKKIHLLQRHFWKEFRRLCKYYENKDVEPVEPALWYFKEMMFILQNEPNIPASVLNTSHETKSTNGLTYTTHINKPIIPNSTEIYKNAVQDIPLNKKEVQQEKLEQKTFMIIKQPSDYYDRLGAAWAAELRNMEFQQQLFAKKAINDVLFEGQLGNLNRYSVEINATNLNMSTPSRQDPLDDFGSI